MLSEVCTLHPSWRLIINNSDSISCKQNLWGLGSILFFRRAALTLTAGRGWAERLNPSSGTAELWAQKVNRVKAVGSFNIKIARLGDRWRAGPECAHQVQSVNKRIDSWPRVCRLGEEPRSHFVLALLLMRGWISAGLIAIQMASTSRRVFWDTAPNWHNTFISYSYTPSLIASVTFYNEAVHACLHC